MNTVFDESKNPVILNKFLYHLICHRNYSLNTVREYNYDLNCFFRFIKVYFNLTAEKKFKDIDIKDVDVFLLNRVKSTDIYAFLISLNYSKNSKVNTRKRKLNSISSFYKWLSGNYPCVNNPILNIEKPMEVNRLPKYLTLEKCKKIINIYNINIFCIKCICS